MTTESDLRTFREFLLQYNAVTEHCFNSCVVDFSRREVSDKEDLCTRNCMEKFLKAGQRLSMRFQEHQMLNMEAQGAPISVSAAASKM
ncbi:unnamed protein product [Meloidogyne enterolobii]|uniref:Mitochondrial import inner membrane translocase subunit n=5 Tax=Meloidogyne TaxID=189290 RepID=A0A6V7VZ37_MELEN|nr:unnamed protein product [Meloidogyne enterolobii]CAD2179461.1 unnamed protein product [Meloidogyne enterolobii]CAD2200608.1 unnamed protein product [Meloidogyne enterolobii]